MATGVITQFTSAMAEQRRFLADTTRTRCPQTAANSVNSGAPLGQTPAARGLSSDEIIAQREQNLTQFLLKACSAEAASGDYPPFMQSR